MDRLRADLRQEVRNLHLDVIKNFGQVLAANAANLASVLKENRVLAEENDRLKKANARLRGFQ